MFVLALRALFVPVGVAAVAIFLLATIAWLIAVGTARLIRHPVWRRVTAFLLHFTVFTALLVVGANYYVYHGFGYQGDIYRKGDPAQPWVALTFDDGPSPEYTPRILDILREYEVPATFFMVGVHVEKYPDIARRIVAEGHEVGNHTYTHINVPTASTRRLTQELIHTTHIIYETTGQYPTYARPPRGLYDGRYRRLTALQGQSVVLWTLSSQDWQIGANRNQLVRRVLSRVKPGDIILFHDSGALIRHEGGNRMATVEALPAIIEGIRALGLEIVPLSVLLAQASPETNGGMMELDWEE